MLINLEQLQRSLEASLRTEIAQIIEEESNAAAERVRERVRGKTGEIAAKVASWVDFQKMTNELRITVRTGDTNG
jgi:D-ribose pyranose/furanose isomerase RbsD